MICLNILMLMILIVLNLLGNPYHASVQLMSILPKQSKNLIPSKYHYFMNDINSPIGLLSGLI